MKLATTSIVTGIILLLWLPSSAIGVPIVSLSPSSSVVSPGDSFTIDVWVNGSAIGQDLLAFGFDVDTTGSYFSYEGYTMGPGFDDDSDPSNLDNVAGSAFPGLTDDDVLLATLSFAAGPIDGTDTVQVLGLYDALFSGLFYEIDGYDINASATVTVSSSIPDASSLTLLLSASLFGAGVLARRFDKNKRPQT